jgi:hypothetical protein
MRRTRAKWRHSERTSAWSEKRERPASDPGAAARAESEPMERSAAPLLATATRRSLQPPSCPHQCERPTLCGQRRSGWAAAHSCANQWPGCGARPRLGFAARGRCGPSPSGLQGLIYLGQNVSEQDVARVTPIRRPADGERQSLYFAHAMCTDRDLVAGVARARLPYAANMVSGVDAAGCARGAGPGTAEAAARLTGIRCEGRGNFD